MDREEIIRMAREAGFDPHDMSDDFTCNLIDIERFAALVAAAERERVLELEDVAKEALDAIHYWTWHGETQESTALLNVSHDNLRDVLYPVGNDQMYRPDEE